VSVANLLKRHFGICEVCLYCNAPSSVLDQIWSTFGGRGSLWT